MTDMTARQAADLLAKDADTIDERLEPVVLRGVLDIKDDTRSRLARSGDPRGEFAARQVSADMIEPLTGEVGYASEFEPLTRAFEYGTAHTPPRRALGGATDTEADQFHRAVAKTIQRRPR